VKILKKSGIGYFNFMKTTGFALDMLKTDLKGEILNQPMIDYELSSGKKIQLMKVEPMTRQF